MAERSLAEVVSVRFGGGKRDTQVLGFRRPRTTLFLSLSTRGLRDLPSVIERVAGPDVTLMLHPSDPDGILDGRFDEAETLGYRPRENLEFLWWFRDHHDPLTLGHASDRTLFHEALVRSPVPDYRRAPNRKARRRAVEEIREMILDVGNALGSRPPLPPCRLDAGGWSPERVGDVLDACTGLYAGLLHRWQAPVARVEAGEVVLADRFLRTRIS